MSSVRTDGKAIRLRAANVGGIDRTEVEFTPGITVLAGKNATNRTSLLQALMAALGSDRASLKGNAAEGEVELSTGDETYLRTLTRRNGSVVMGGEAYLDDAELANLFAFLLESNEARLAVARREDLRELIMRPIDTNEITARIDELETEKRRLDDRLDEIEGLKRRLPTLEQRKTELQNEIDEVREALGEQEAKIEASDASVEESRSEDAELDRKLDELRDTRAELEDVRFRIDSQRESIAALKEDRAALEAEGDELPEGAVDERDDVESRLSELREERRSVDAQINQLQSVVQFNEEMLEGTNSAIRDVLRGDESAGGDEALTDQLVSDQVVCWTCGSEVGKGDIEDTLERLREFRQDRLQRRSSLRADIRDLEQEKDTIEQTRRRRERIERRLADVESELDERGSTVEELEETESALTEEIQALEEAVEELETEEHSQILDLHREANRLEFQLGRLQDDQQDVVAEIAEVEGRLDEESELDAEREQVRSDLEELRTRIDRIEERAVEAFNGHMNTVLDVLDYANLERIWIERVGQSGGGRGGNENVFELHIVRSNEDGVTYEDTIDHLSESEREVTGLVFALAGYLVHEVYETVPFMLLDSLEAIDSDRIAALVDYFSEYTDYLIVALLPEDAAALDDAIPRVAEI